MVKTIKACVEMLLQDREILENLEYREGQTILIQGTACDCAFLIIQGNVQLSYLKDEEPQELRIAKKGEVIGDLDWLNLGAHLFTAHAIDHVICLKLPNENMMKHYLKSPPAIQGILRNTVNTFRSIIGEDKRVTASDVKLILQENIPQKMVDTTNEMELLDDTDSFAASMVD